MLIFIGLPSIPLILPKPSDKLKGKENNMRRLLLMFTKEPLWTIDDDVPKPSLAEV